MCTQGPSLALVSHGQLVSLQAFESTLKSWEDKQKGEVYRAPSRQRLSSQQSMEYLTEEEAAQMQQLVRATETLISRCQTRQTLKVTPLQSLPWKPSLALGSCFPAGTDMWPVLVGDAFMTDAVSVPHHG